MKSNKKVSSKTNTDRFHLVSRVSLFDLVTLVDMQIN